MKTVLVDMDEVLVDLVASWLDMYHELGGERVYKDQVVSYNFETSGLIKDMPLFWKALDRAPAMRVAKPLPGAMEALKKLTEHPELDVYIVTYARTESWGKAHEAKLAWLWQHAPWFDRDKVMFVRNKELVRGDYLVEDNTHTLEKWDMHTRFGKALLIHQPWNEGVPWHRPYKFGSFADAAEYILEDVNE